MTRILTKHIATMTEMREPHKVLERAGGHPVAVMRNSKLVGHFVPAERVPKTEPRHATREELEVALAETAEMAAPVLEYLEDE